MQSKKHEVCGKLYDFHLKEVSIYFKSVSNHFICFNHDDHCGQIIKIFN
jgi:hypothetical protein